jgi:hypothetical protein
MIELSAGCKLMTVVYTVLGLIGMIMAFWALRR